MLSSFPSLLFFKLVWVKIFQHDGAMINKDMVFKFAGEELFSTRDTGAPSQCVGGAERLVTD